MEKKYIFCLMEGTEPIPITPETYRSASAYLLEYFNITKLGRAFYGVDKASANQNEIQNAGNKMRAKIRNAKPSTIKKINKILFPHIKFLSDQDLKAMEESLKNLTK